jgi:ParB-like chromosome segregation protein Spo0J
MTAMDDDFEEEIEIPIKQLEFDPPSRHDEGHIARIADSIAFTGLLNPIIAHRIAEPVGGKKYKVDAGEGRVHAHLYLGKKKIRVRVYKYDPTLTRLRHIDENIARVEVDSYEWDRLVTERIEIVKTLDPNNRVIQDTRRPKREKKQTQNTEVNDSEDLSTPETATVADAPRQTTQASYVVADEVGCSPRKVERAKARVEKAAPEVAQAHANGDLKATQLDELIKIADPVVQAEVATQVLGKTKEETKEIVAEIVKAPDARLDSEMASAAKMAAALTVRLQTISRLLHVEGLAPSDVVRARFTDTIEGLTIALDPITGEPPCPQPE